MQSPLLTSPHPHFKIATAEFIKKQVREFCETHGYHYSTSLFYDDHPTLLNLSRLKIQKNRCNDYYPRLQKDKHFYSGIEAVLSQAGEDGPILLGFIPENGSLMGMIQSPENTIDLESLGVQLASQPDHSGLAEKLRTIMAAAMAAEEKALERFKTP